MTHAPTCPTPPPTEGTPLPAAGATPAERWGRHGQDGITTAEYAVGTAAGAGLAGLLYTMLTGSFGSTMLKNFFGHVFGLLGIG